MCSVRLANLGAKIDIDDTTHKGMVLCMRDLGPMISFSVCSVCLAKAKLKIDDDHTAHKRMVLCMQAICP